MVRQVPDRNGDDPTPTQMVMQNGHREYASTKFHEVAWVGRGTCMAMAVRVRADPHFTCTSCVCVFPLDTREYTNMYNPILCPCVCKHVPDLF